MEWRGRGEDRPKTLQVGRKKMKGNSSTIKPTPKNLKKKEEQTEGGGTTGGKGTVITHRQGNKKGKKDNHKPQFNPREGMTPPQ